VGCARLRGDRGGSSWPLLRSSCWPPASSH
jgi:hypothetical protein